MIQNLKDLKEKIEKYRTLLFYPINKEDMDIAMEDDDETSIAGEREFIDENIEILNNLLLEGAEAHYEIGTGYVVISYEITKIKKIKSGEIRQKQMNEAWEKVRTNIQNVLRHLKRRMKKHSNVF